MYVAAMPTSAIQLCLRRRLSPSLGAASRSSGEEPSRRSRSRPRSSSLGGGLQGRAFLGGGGETHSMDGWATRTAAALPGERFLARPAAPRQLLHACRDQGGRLDSAQCIQHRPAPSRLSLAILRQ